MTKEKKGKPRDKKSEKTRANSQKVNIKTNRKKERRVLEMCTKR